MNKLVCFNHNTWDMETVDKIKKEYLSTKIHNEIFMGVSSISIILLIEEIKRALLSIDFNKTFS
jgi:hypothetical protein